jgi:hypothetical protein
MILQVQALLICTLEPKFNVGHFEPSGFPSQYWKEGIPGSQHDVKPLSQAEFSEPQSLLMSSPGPCHGECYAQADYKSPLLQVLLYSVFGGG